MFVALIGGGATGQLLMGWQTVGKVFLLSLTAALNPTLVAVSTIMLLLDHPKKLMLGYLLGALTTSITLGLVIVFALKRSGAVSTTQHAVSPGIDLAIGALALVGACVLATGRDERLRERRRRHKDPKKAKKTPRWQRALNQGSARTRFSSVRCSRSQEPPTSPG